MVNVKRLVQTFTLSDETEEIYGEPIYVDTYRLLGFQFTANSDTVGLDGTAYIETSNDGVKWSQNASFGLSQLSGGNTYISSTDLEHNAIRIFIENDTNTEDGVQITANMLFKD